MGVAPETQAPRLTPRQLDVLELLAKGLTNREIGGVLGISAATVKHHVSAVIEALDVSNRTEAATALRDLGLARDSATEETPVPGFGARPAIAVLPFDAFGGDPEQQVFADGLVEDLTSQLAAVRWFPVIARNSAFTYRGRAVRIRDVSSELGVRYVIEGSVRRAGDGVRIQLQVIEGQSGEHVFARKFDRSVEDVFAVQDEIVESIVGALEPALSRVEGIRALRAPVHSASAWEHFQRGMALVAAQGTTQIEEALGHFERAIELDAAFAPAHAGRAMAQFGRGIFQIGDTQGSVTDEASLQRALVRAAACFEESVASGRTATQLDPLDAMGWLGLGAGLALSGRSDTALGALERALDLNPSSALACWALGNLLGPTDRWSEAGPLFERAIRLSPRDPYLHHFEGALAGTLLRADNVEEALAHARRSVEIEPEPGGISYQPVLVSCLGWLDRREAAEEALEEMRRRFPHWNFALVHLLTAPDLAERIIEGIRRAGYSG